MGFRDKIAVVTGAAEGASVVVSDVDEAGVAEYGGLAILLNNVDVPQFAASIRARSRVEETAP